jgi:hypothetical protein
LACDDRRREGGPRQLGGSVLLPISPPAEASAGVLENPAAHPERDRVHLLARSCAPVAEQGGDPRRVGRSGPRKPSGRFNARGRGREAAASLAGHGGWESASGEPWTGGMRYRARRVVVKARVVKLKGVDSRAIAAHLPACSARASPPTASTARPTQARTIAPTPGRLPIGGWRTGTSSGSSLPPRTAWSSGTSRPSPAS